MTETTFSPLQKQQTVAEAISAGAAGYVLIQVGNEELLRAIEAVRRGQALLYDLFDSTTNYNAVIAAESGAGKSFLANDLIMSYLQQGAVVRIVPPPLFPSQAPQDALT